MVNRNSIGKKYCTGLLHSGLIFLLLISCNNNNREQKKHIGDTVVQASSVQQTTEYTPSDSVMNNTGSSALIVQAKTDTILSLLKNINNMVQGNNNDSTIKNTSPLSTQGGDTESYYHEPLPDNYIIPIMGSGDDFYYQYYGGGILKGQKNGISFSISATPEQTGKWNVYFKGFGKFSELGIAAHYSFLLNNGFTRTILNDDHKVYTEEKAPEKIQQKKYTVSAIEVTNKGFEKLHGFNCMHAKINGTSTFMGKQSKIDIDIWRSIQLPGASLMETAVQTMISPFTTEMEDKLQQINCKGAIVKVVIQDPASQVIKELYSVTKKDFPGSYFSIPPGYKEDKNTELYFLYK
jgi:hypothetical protein